MLSRHFGRALLLAAAFAMGRTNFVSAQHEQHAVERANAQTELTGITVCSDGPILPGAVVQLFHDSHPIASALTDQTGRFRLRAPNGEYTLKVTYLGHADAANRPAQRVAQSSRHTPCAVGQRRHRECAYY